MKANPKMQGQYAISDDWNETWATNLVSAFETQRKQRY